MKIKVAELVSKVYNLLDENETIIEERVEYGDPGAMLKPLIIDLLPDAARVCINNASPADLDDCIRVADLPVTSTPRTTIELPADFLKLVYICMSDWDYGVTVAMNGGSEQHQLRMRPRKGSCHSAAAVAIRYRGEMKYLEVFGSMPGSRLKCLDYVPVPEINGKYINLPKGLVTAVCAKTAEMVKQIIM